MDYRRRFVLALVFATTVGLTAITFAQTYTVTDLGTLGGSSTEAHAINNFGQITGSSNVNSTVSHAFLYTAGTITDIPTLGGNIGIGLGINDSGTVVGYTTQADGSYRGFIYSGGVLTAIPPESGSYGTAYGINASGQVIGNSTTSSNVPSAFIYQNGVLTDLGGLGGVDGTNAFGINSAGQVVGYSYNKAGNFLAFLWQNGRMKSLGTLGGDWSQAYAINDARQVTGTAYLKGNLGPHAFLFNKGVMTDVDGRSSSLISWGFGINKSGVIVGQMQIPGGQFVIFHAMVITNGKMQDLNGLIPSGTGWTLDTAYGINNAGQIVGYGDLNKQTHGFLLTPQ